MLHVKEAEGNSHAVILMKNGNQVLVQAFRPLFRSLTWAGLNKRPCHVPGDKGSRNKIYEGCLLLNCNEGNHLDNKKVTLWQISLC